MSQEMKYEFRIIQEFIPKGRSIDENIKRELYHELMATFNDLQAFYDHNVLDVIHRCYKRKVDVTKQYIDLVPKELRTNETKIIMRQCKRCGKVAYIEALKLNCLYFPRSIIERDEHNELKEYKLDNCDDYHHLIRSVISEMRVIQLRDKCARLSPDSLALGFWVDGRTTYFCKDCHYTELHYSPKVWVYIKTNRDYNMDDLEKLVEALNKETNKLKNYEIICEGINHERFWIEQIKEVLKEVRIENDLCLKELSKDEFADLRTALLDFPCEEYLYQHAGYEIRKVE